MNVPSRIYRMRLLDVWKEETDDEMMTSNSGGWPVYSFSPPVAVSLKTIRDLT